MTSHTVCFFFFTGPVTESNTECTDALHIFRLTQSAIIQHARSSCCAWSETHTADSRCYLWCWCRLQVHSKPTWSLKALPLPQGFQRGGKGLSATDDINLLAFASVWLCAGDCAGLYQCSNADREWSDVKQKKNLEKSAVWEALQLCRILNDYQG